ncbi:hypothetical protein H2248_010131 [Termitomyces sp. 'cryptogamus']|nr:hypothetical protein H2248_010131 [Termitomyces sp. 'cryptogamus']
MPSRASSVLKSTMIFSFLTGAGALDFNVSPISIFLSQMLVVSWNFSSGDADLFELGINCDTMSIPLLNPEVVQTAASSFHFDIPDEAPQFQLPTECHLLANTNSDPHDPLETITTATFTILAPLREPTSISSEKSLTTPESDSTTSASVSMQLTPTPTLPFTTSPTDASSSLSFENVIPTMSSISQSITAASGSTKTSATPTGLIVGVVVGALVGLGILIIIFICFRRRRTLSPPCPTPVPLPYDPSYIQPLDKNSQLAQITREREAAQRQHDQLQDTISLRESAHNGLSGFNDTSAGSGPLEQQLAAVRQRMLELAVQQRDLEYQLYGEQPPPSYSNSSSVL